MTGISRKLPDTERTRLKKILKKVMPEDAGVIVRTAAEGATEEELSRDVARLAAQWENIERKAKTASAPELLYGEPDLTIRVIRDVFNEDFSQLIVEGDEGWAEVEEYVRYVAPHLADRVARWEDDSKDAFAEYHIDEQLAKALERKVWLPSGGSLVIDRTEAMTVIDVNTGKFTGQGGNLEETVTRNNLEAAEEIVRQLRLRDVGGIVVIDFIDMVLESNRELVLRRLLECLARDRTKHQVAEVTSLGLVQMTRKRVGAGLLEAFSVPCECCNGRGVHVSLDLADLGQPGQGCQQATQPGGHSRGGKHDNRRADEPSGRRRGGDNGDPGHGGGDSLPDGDGGKGRGGESKPAGSGRRRRGGQNRAAADSGSPSGVTGAPEAGGAPDAAGGPDAPAATSHNGTAPHSAEPVPGSDLVSGPGPAVEPPAPAGGTEVVAPFRTAGSEPVAGQEPAAPGPETVTE
jgi:ribonuclease E